MKKIKFFRKNEIKKKTEKEQVEERRGEVLAKGRKFKYPIQYAKHKIIFNTIIIAIVAIVAIVVFGWTMLYKVQNTGNTFYRITQVLPLSVAKIDGEKVNFSDYLMIYRSSMATVEQSEANSEGDIEVLKSDYKRVALDEAEEFTYALKKARELNVSVSDDEIDTSFEEHKQMGGTNRSDESFLKILSENFGLSKQEYRRMLYFSLMRAKVESEIDDEANKIADEIEAMLAENGGDYGVVAESLAGAVIYESTGGLVDGKNVDGGRAVKAMTLEAGENSGKFLSNNGDGYYFVKLISKNDTQVNYESLKVTFSEFEKEVNELREQGKIQEFIEIGEKN